MKLKKIVKNIATGAMFGTTIDIGPYSIEFPVSFPDWNSLDDIIDEGLDIVDILIVLASVVAVAMIIVAGYKLITASGDPEKIESGQKTLTASVVGLIIVWAVGLIIKLVLQVTTGS
jgi:hypothetical protein